MSKKIMILSGSPRKKGNTNTVVGWFVEGAKDAGADVEVIDVAQLKSKNNGCIACLGCQKSDKFECAVDDEMKPVLAKIPDNDVVVFATPVYFFGPSAQLKLLMDRMYSLIKLDPEKGNYYHNLGKLKLGLIATAGGDINPGLSLVEQTFKATAGFAGIEIDSLLVPFASMYNDDIKQDGELRERAMAFGRKLAR
ncbi:MAG: flavodoxin family protein [Nitrospirae bacterium]|nr:flavodoxin family protein [Nitrospirota bacterium]MBI3378531.1 flavodoxin family protein [Nitrospirota bacterium]